MYRRKIAYLFAYRNGIREQSVGILRQYGEEEAPEVTLELLRRPEREERWSIYYFNRRDRLLEADFLWEIGDVQKMSGASVERYRLCTEAGMGRGVLLLPENVGTARKSSIEWPNTDFYLCGRYDGKEVTEAQVCAAFSDTGAGIYEEECVGPARRLFEEITKAAGGEKSVKEDESRETGHTEKTAVLKRKAAGSRIACLDELLSTKPAYNPFREASLLYSVRISPEELSFLPKEGGRLAENSFLLHGYYYYRHLLLGKRRQREQEDYVVLVPGMYLKRDICLAGLFGFFEFLPIQYAVPEDVSEGQAVFGYWCAKI